MQAVAPGQGRRRHTGMSCAGAGPTGRAEAAVRPVQNPRFARWRRDL